MAKRVEVTLKLWKLQMVTRVQLDVSHVFRGVTVRREKKVQVYKEHLTDFWGTLSEHFLVHFDSLRTVPWVEIFSLSFWWFFHWLGRRSAIGRSGATLFSWGSCEELRREEQRLTWCKADPKERSLTWQDSCTQVKRQDHFVFRIGS